VRIDTLSRTIRLALAALQPAAVVIILGLFQAWCGRPDPGPAALSERAEGFPSSQPSFVRVPSPADWSWANWVRRPPRTFALAHRWGPYYDLRQVDLREVDLEGRAGDLLRSVFDTETKWPAALPPGFDPAKVLEANKDPGLGIRAIHERGITGKGISVAVIDAPLLLDHEEYGDRLRFYGEVNAGQAGANFHGTLVTSILAGRSCGVAPGAEIYYVGSHNYDIADESGAPNAKHYARAVELLLEVNARLPLEKRIRVISISAGCGPRNPGTGAMSRAIRKAADAGIFVVSGNIAVDVEPGMWFWGLDRRALDDPNDASACSPVNWKSWISQISGRDGFDGYYERRLRSAGSGASAPEFLLVSEGPRTVASPFGRASYGFYPLGGWSSVLPQIAGLYALACEARPDITPDAFWRAALATGDPMPVDTEWATYAGKRVDPARLIESLRRSGADAISF
jgi:hypothetical protein